jgi:large subunit ribosomal protein L17
VLRHIHRPDIVKILFDEIAPKYTDRQGGYTRIVKLGFRDNDSASVSQLELVDYAEMMADSGDSTEKKKRKTKKMVKAVTKAETQTDNEE